MTGPNRGHAPHTDEPRPWEMPGAVRRDVEPHRGDLLRLLRTTMMVCAVLSPFVLPGAVSLVFGVVVFRMARHDLSRMRAGAMDPAGWEQAESVFLEVVAAWSGVATGWLCWTLLLFVRPS
jgi:hypothetical protein